jgi:uncharacterized protein (TIGR02118 family)
MPSIRIISRLTCRWRKNFLALKYDVSKGTVAAPAGASGIHLVATLYFDSLDAIKTAFSSAEGQATGSDLANFADGGADLYFFDTKEV